MTRNIISHGNRVMLKHIDIYSAMLGGSGDYDYFIDTINRNKQAYVFMHFPLLSRVAIRLKYPKHRGIIIVDEESICNLNQKKITSLGNTYTNEDVKEAILEQLRFKYRLGGMKWIVPISEKVIGSFRHLKFWRK